MPEACPPSGRTPPFRASAGHRYPSYVTAPPPTSPPLVTLARVVLEHAKTIRAHGKRLHAWVLGLGIFAVLVQAAPALLDAAQQVKWLVPTSKVIAYICALASLLLQGLRWWLQRVAADWHSLGSTIKRRALLIESLGPSSEQLDIRLLRDLAGADAEQWARAYSMPEPYYASTHAPGLERLRENLQESAFFSHSLYRKAARAGFIKFGITVGCIIVGLLAVAALAPREMGPVIANCILAFVAFLVSADQLGQAMNWYAAATAVERVERRLEMTTPNGPEPYMAAFADYEAATAMAPAVPTALYERERERLDRLWRERRVQR